MTQKQAKASKLRDSGVRKLHNRSDQFIVTRGGALVATGDRALVWSYTATHDGDLVVRIAP
jgi:hypothetical protein